MKHILVTGGAGFVGSRLAMGLCEARPECAVVALDNLKRRGAELNLPRLKAAGVRFLHGDIRNPADIEAVGPIDCILECSAEPSVLAGYDGSPSYLLDTNLGGTIHCLEAARKKQAAFIFLSTSRVYPMERIASLNYTEGESRFELAAEQITPGVSPQGFSEDFPLEGSRSLYGATKLCSELLFQEYLAMYGMQGLVNRCGVLTGPWQMGKVDQGVIVLWAARHFFGGSLKYIGYGGAGKQVRDILHVDDLLELILYQIDHLGELTGRTFNVGGSREVSVSLRELTALCADLTGKTIDITAEPDTRDADIPLYLSDIRRVREATGWRPTRSVEWIMEDIVAWIRDNAEALAPILG